MKQAEPKTDEFTTIRVHDTFAHWLKVEAAKAGESMYEYLESRFPGWKGESKGKRS
jgi:hypothetical protein